MSRHRRPRPVRGLLLAPLAAACALAATAPAAGAAVTWRDCATPQTAPGLECASVPVPLDWDRPDGRTITIAIDRLRATGPGEDLGPLLVNPGGPGGSGVDVVAQGGMMLDTPALAPVRQRFDVVGFDPRGIGASTPIRCGDRLADASVTPLPTTPALLRDWTQANRRAGRECKRLTGRLLQTADSTQTARDIDAIRRALGARRISWLGVSYGTELGQEYADRFPRRVRAMVLDGSIDHTIPARQAVVEEAASEAGTFDRFAAWCAATATCALHGQDPLAVLDRLTAAGDAGGVPDSALGRPVNGVEVTKGAYNQVIFTGFWDGLAKALAQADGQAGPADAAALVPAFLATADPVYRTVGCEDLGGRLRSAAEARAILARIRAVAPHTWRYTEYWDIITGCTGWPVRISNPPAPRHISGVPGVLVVGNRSDPSTPLVFSQGLASQIDGSRLLVYEGAGHTGLFNSVCAAQQEAAYLVSATLPPPGTSCPEEPVVAIGG